MAISLPTWFTATPKKATEFSSNQDKYVVRFSSEGAISPATNATGNYNVTFNSYSQPFKQVRISKVFSTVLLQVGGIGARQYIRHVVVLNSFTMPADELYLGNISPGLNTTFAATPPGNNQLIIQLPFADWRNGQPFIYQNVINKFMGPSVLVVNVFINDTTLAVNDDLLVTTDIEFEIVAR